MDATKIRLSPEERELVLRPDWILTKNNILAKVRQLLEHVQSVQQPYLSGLPAEVQATNAKVSRGENYKGLPYLVLDQPRYFNREHVFAIRTLFWWGHFFSSTLHLAGNYKAMYAEKIIPAFDLLQQAGFYICINADQWEHHFEAGNFVPLNTISADGFETIIRSNSFIKLSKKISLEQWENAGRELPEIFRQFISILL
jgi:hypothetical protein